MQRQVIYGWIPKNIDRVFKKNSDKGVSGECWDFVPDSIECEKQKEEFWHSRQWPPKKVKITVEAVLPKRGEK